MNKTTRGILENLKPEEVKIVLEKIVELASCKEEEEKNFSFKIKDYSEMKSQEEYMVYEDARDLKFGDDRFCIRKMLNISIKEVSKGGVNVKLLLGKENVEGKILLNSKDSNYFVKEFEGCSILCSSDISYSPLLECFSLSNIIVYRHLEPLKKWSAMLSGKSLLERINTVLEVIGLNPENLIYQEKMITMGRLIPLGVKKVLLLDISKKELGKTQTYVSLGFDPYTLVATRANLIVDGRSGKGGDFFLEKTAFILDELTKLTDTELITAIQIYMNGEKYKGKITINGNNKKETDTSIVILGNVKLKTDLLYLYAERKQLFENTIIMTSPDGEAFVSRITTLLNSWGCRTFSPDMKSKKENSAYDRSLLREALIELREKKFDINLFQEALGLQWKSSSIRTQESIEKNFEGLVKILFPEYVDNPSIYEIRERLEEFQFLYERGIEFRKTVDNQLKIIDPKNNKENVSFMLDSTLKRVMFNIDKPHILTPHRVFISLGNGNVEKVATDYMGIELNRKEAKFLNRIGRNHNLSVNDTILIHSLSDTRQSFSNFGMNYGGATFCMPFSTQQNYPLNFNFLVGEIEKLDENCWDTIQKLSFYDLI